jgi:hypothetical protein
MMAKRVGDTRISEENVEDAAIALMFIMTKVGLSEKREILSTIMMENEELYAELYNIIPDSELHQIMLRA